MTTWNPSDKSFLITLSGGDLIATDTIGGPNTVRATTSNASGKFYFEIVIGQTYGGEAGVLAATGSVFAGIGQDANGWSAQYKSSATRKAHNNSYDSLASGWTTGDVAMVAVDFDAGKIWFGSNGTWFASGDPAAGSNPVFTSVSGTLFAAWSSTPDGSGSGTARFSASAMGYTIPSGFAAWDGSIPPSVGEAAGTSTATGVGNINGNAAYEASGSASAAAVSSAVVEAVGDAYGIATGVFVPLGVGIAESVGVASVSAEGVLARVGDGAAAGRCFVTARFDIPSETDWLNPAIADPDAIGGFDATPSRVMKTTDLSDQRWGLFGTTVASLNDGAYNDGSPYVSAVNEYLTAAIAGTTKKVDRIVIWSSTLDASDQINNPTFAEPGDSGLIGDASGDLFIQVFGSGGHAMFYGDGFGGGDIYNTTISNNRATKLVIDLPTPMDVGGVKISGGVSSVGPLRTGTVIHEVELLHTYTLWEIEVEDVVVATDALLAGHRVTVEESTGNSLDLYYNDNFDPVETLIGTLYAKPVDVAVVTEELILGVKTNAVGAASGTSTAAARVILEEVLESSGDATATVVPVRALTLESSGVLAATATSKLVHAETSSAAAASSTQGENVVTDTEESTGEATDTVIGIRRVTVIEESGAVVTPETTPKKTATLALVSAGAASTTLVATSFQTETLESIGFADDTILLPFQGTYPVFWTNTIGAAGAIWNGLPFNSIVEVGGVVYAAGPSGVFEMGDEIDDLDADIASEVEWDLVDNGSVQMKRMRSIYVKARAPSPFTVRIANEQGIFDYPTDEADSGSLTNHRAPIGRGLLARQARVSLLHTKAFVAETAGIGILQSSRRI